MDKNNFGSMMQPRRRLLKSWVTPVAISVVLPVHAEVTAPPPGPNILNRDLRLDLQLQTCSTSMVTVRICNNEPFDVDIYGGWVEEYPQQIGSLTLGFRTVSPAPPIAISIGECVTVSFSTKETRVYWCGSAWRLIVAGGSQGAYGEYDLVHGAAYQVLRDNDPGTATSTPSTI